MGNLTITCPCGMKGTYFGAYAVRGRFVSMERSVILWHDPKVERVEDLKISVQLNIEVPVYRCLLCSFKDAKQDTEERKARDEARLEQRRLKAQARAARPSIFSRLFGRRK